MSRSGLDATRWFKRPECDPHLLAEEPRLECWNEASDPAQVRLQEYLGRTESLLAPARADGPWALRLDVGLPTGRNLLDMADLDNYLYPLAKRLAGDFRLGNSGLVSAWCTKQHGTQSFVRIARAERAPVPTTAVLVARTAPPAKTYKHQIRTHVVDAAELPAGPVRLEMAFVVGPGRNWLNLWKPTIDALDPILGRTRPERDWHPLDGRITELGMHLTVDGALRHDVLIGIVATPA